MPALAILSAILFIFALDAGVGLLTIVPTASAATGTATVDEEALTQQLKDGSWASTYEWTADSSGRAKWTIRNIGTGALVSVTNSFGDTKPTNLFDMAIKPVIPTDITPLLTVDVDLAGGGLANMSNLFECIFFKGPANEPPLTDKVEVQITNAGSGGQGRTTLTWHPKS